MSAVSSGCKNEPLFSNHCVEGEVRDCTCPNGDESMQTCGAKGFGVCLCSDVPVPDGGTAGNAGSSGEGGAGAGGMSGVSGEEDSGMPEAGSSGMGGDLDAGTDAAMEMDSAVPPAPYAQCNSDKDCAAGDKCTMNGTKKYCAKPCTMMSDCPAPSDGTATPSCPLGAPQVCALACPALTMCPTGMTCQLLAGTCSW